MASAAGGDAAQRLPGLQLCDIADITFDSSTKPKEGGFGKMHAVTRPVVYYERT
jgi:hypothetical protein